jgi:hypothetical protein
MGRYYRPNSNANSILNASQFVTEFANEQQKIKEKKKLEVEKAKQNKALQDARDNVARLKKEVELGNIILADYSTVINDLKNSFGPKPYDAGELALLNPAVTNFTQQKIILSKLNTRLIAADNLEKSINNQLISSSAAAVKKEFDKKLNGKGKKLNTISSSSIENNDLPKPPPQQTFTGYKYNVPMIRSEYFTDRSPQTKTTVRGGSGPGNYSDAINMFSGTNIAKGTLQMPRDLTKSAAWKNKTGIYKEDSTMYGFKFLYNPTEVSMGWGMVEIPDPNTIRSGAAGGLAPISGVGLSTIDFTLLLNRISDMNFLDENGLAPGEDATIEGPYEGINPIQRVEDLKMIYRRGTMYDLEYLFRVINGPSAIHQTTLNGLSADWGFLIGSQVELFLGDGLRYLVRLNGINVNHRIFNDRMVPVISEVSISLGRYNDVGIKQPGDDRSQG